MDLRGNWSDNQINMKTVWNPSTTWTTVCHDKPIPPRTCETWRSMNYENVRSTSCVFINWMEELWIRLLIYAIACWVQPSISYYQYGYIYIRKRILFTNAIITSELKSRVSQGVGIEGCSCVPATQSVMMMGDCLPWLPITFGKQLVNFS